MKIKSFEHREIRQLLAKLNIPQAQYQLRKKRGWLYLEIEGKSQLFAYHRSEITTLVGQSFQSHTEYEVKCGDATSSGLTWSHVLQKLEDWLD